MVTGTFNVREGWLVVGNSKGFANAKRKKEVVASYQWKLVNGALTPPQHYNAVYLLRHPALTSQRCVRFIHISNPHKKTKDNLS